MAPINSNSYVSPRLRAKMALFEIKFVEPSWVLVIVANKFSIRLIVLLPGNHMSWDFYRFIYLAWVA